MRNLRFVPILALGLYGAACDKIFGGGVGEEVLNDGKAKLEGGDIPGGYDALVAAGTAHPDSPHAVTGAAYAHMIAGETSEADALLAAFEAKAGDKVGEVKLRRALVALAAGEFDQVKEHGNASGLPAGALLAAEVHLSDAESDEAIRLLNKAAEGGGEVAETAKQYLQMLESGDQYKAGLAEAAALWALGQRGVACETAGDLVKAMPDDSSDKGTLLVLWAGRAVTSGKTEVASGLLEAAEFADIPPEQQWRVQATKAMVSVASGDGASAVQVFTLLEQAGAPADGLADARATACALAKDKDVAKELVQGMESAAAARCLSEAGAGVAAASAAPQGSAIKQYLEGK